MDRWFFILVFHLLLNFTVKINSQYIDDADYNNFDFYDDFAIDYDQNRDVDLSETSNNKYNFDNDESMQNGNEEYFIVKNNILKWANEQNSNDRIKSYAEKYNWYKSSEKIYRYTKHRIPGYDYDELDYAGAKNFQYCDDKSVWTHCVCQFTCLEPDIVDCYTPCKSGCECKEDYVFDEKIKQCVPPDLCQPNQESILN